MTTAAGASGLVARLEAELRDLWTKPGDPAAPPTSRVCTMNIEVVAPSTELLERYTPVIDEVTATIPARAILAAIEPEREDSALDGTATAVCWLENGHNICSERITLTCRGEAVTRAASAIESLLVPELPTALVWLGRVHTDDPVFEELAAGVHRIVLDSDYTSLSSVIEVAAWARARRDPPEIADLAWMRISAWQELLARFFDPAGARELASKVTRVVVTQAGQPGARLGPEGALVLGWLGTRLGWTISRLAGRLRFKRPDGVSVVVELAAVARPEGVAPHTLAGIVVEAGDDRRAPRLSGTIERELGSGLAGAAGSTTDADVLHWRRVESGAPPFEQRLRLSANKAARWLERALRRPARDPAFAEAVAFAKHIVEDGLVLAREDVPEVNVVTKVVPGLLIATPDGAEAAREACARIKRGIFDAIKERGSATIALSGGSSPLGAYRALAREHIDWGKVHIFWVDERAVPPGDPRSNYGSAKAALLDAITIPAANVHRMPADAPDLAGAAAEYDAELRDTVAEKIGGVPALDLVVLGVGEDGHTASLFPGEDTVMLTDRLVAAVPARGEREARMTLTAPVLENARASVIIALGESKHDALERVWAIKGDLGETPARVVRGFRGSVTWVIDRAAGGMA